MANVDDDACRKYSLILGGLLLAALSLLTLTAVYIEPLDGELTRLGGYAERDFGWNGVQRRLGQDVVLTDHYDRYHDVVVIGDSFSKPGLWQSLFRKETSLSFATLDVVTTSLDEFVAGEPFRSFPPRLMVVEIGERMLLDKFGSPRMTCSQAARVAPQDHPRQDLVATQVSLQDDLRPRTVDLGNVNLKYALLFLQRSFVRSVLGHDFTRVRQYPLTRSDLFTSRRSDRILVYSNDLIKANWTAADVRAAACAIKTLQDRVEANGRTRFALMLVPDKSSAYADYITEPELRSMVRIDPILAAQGINLLPLSDLIKAAIAAREPDVYLPNDTHFGIRGHELAARSLIRFLQ